VILRRVTLFASLALFALACRGASAGASNAAPVAVLFGRADGLIPAIEGRVRGRALWFDLDTGALQSVLDLTQARELRLPSLRPVTVHGAGAGGVPALALKGVAIRLGTLTFTAPRPLAIDLSHVGSTFQGGILGYDFFSRYVVGIDFKTYTVTLFDPRTYRYAGRGAAIPLILRPPRAYVRVAVAAQGVKPEWHVLRLDVGSNDGVDDDIVLRSSAPRRSINAGVGIGRRFQSSLGTVSELRLGPFTLHDLPSATGGVQLIGDEVWHRFNVVFDFSRSVMYLTPR
jgi:Aspartyl protease